MKVIKRDNRIKDFDFGRIWNAVHQAYEEVYDNMDMSVEIGNVLSDLTDMFKNIAAIDSITVEEIQDIVIKCISKYNPYVAERYSDYREFRTIQRNSKLELINEIEGIVDNTNKEVLNENSNKQSYLASTQRDLIAGEVSKYISKTSMIPKHIIDAHNKGKIKLHDLDYYLQAITNCELVDLDDMLQNGTVINKKKIRKPKSLRTAMTLATQIAAQVASCTYGGQTMSLSHLAPFVRVSKEKITKKYYNMGIPESGFASHTEYTNFLDKLIEDELQSEIKDAVQTFNYQVSTLMTTNGQAPFISVCMYINENPEYKDENVMLIAEFLRQRKLGMENEYGVVATQTFPKLLYFLDENNIYPQSKYYWLTVLAAECTGLRMSPDYISVKQMKELYGHAFPCMGCRAFLSPFYNAEGKPIFYGRGNLGVATISLPHAALSSGGDINKFWEILDERLELCREVGELRFNKLKGVKASVAPILWQHGALARLNHDEDITKAIVDKGFTVTIGYSGIYETVKYLTGESHTTEVGFKLAEDIMAHMLEKCEIFKQNQPHLRFALYGTPQESTTGWFSEKLREEFGDIPDITDKGWITNSYHVDIREEIDAFSKLSCEAKLQRYSTGGAVSYIETCNMHHNTEALLEVIKHMYDTIIYAEINFESDVCGKCQHTGTMDYDKETGLWVCPNCGNNDQLTLSVVRRTCGYLGETFWAEGRVLDIINRVKHI